MNKSIVLMFAVAAALGASGAVRINEIMASNGETLKTAAGGEGFDWVELYNDGAECRGSDPCDTVGVIRSVEIMV